MEKNKFEAGKTRCICTDDSVESLNDDSETATVSTDDDEDILEQNKKCICTYDGRVKIPNRVSWVDEADNTTECICEETEPMFDDISSTTVIPPVATECTPPEPKKKKKTFVETLKDLVTCACLRNKTSEESEPNPEPEPEPLEEVSTKDSGVISLLGRTYSSEVSATKDDWKKKPLVLVFDVPKDLYEKKALFEKKLKAQKALAEDIPPTTSFGKLPKKKEPVAQKTLTKDVPPEVTFGKPPKKKEPVAQKTLTKDVTPKVSFGKPPTKKESTQCICTGEDTSSPKYDTKTSSSVSTKASKVKCKCTEPEETPSGHLFATKCVCGQLTASDASLASGYTVASRASKKPDCCYPEKSEEFIRKIDYQRPSQYSYRRYDQPLQTYGREAPSIRRLYTPSATSYADSNQYMLEDDDVSSTNLNDTGSSYSYRKSTSVIPSCCVSETAAAGPSKPTTLYQRLVKRFWLESILYTEPSLPARVQSAPSFLTDTTPLHKPALKYKTDSTVKKPPTTTSKEKVCRCSKSQLFAVPSKESKQKANVEKPKAEQSKPDQSKAEKQCICLKKSAETVSKKSKEELNKECHCLELLYMSKSPSKIEEKVLTKVPSEVSPGTSKDQSKRRESKTGPKIVVSPPEEPKAKATDENGSKSSSNSSVVTVIDTHALRVPSVFDTRPVDVKKSADHQVQGASDSSAENPETAPAPLTNDRSGWWDKSKHLIIGSTVVGATAIGAYQYFKE